MVIELEQYEPSIVGRLDLAVHALRVNLGNRFKGLSEVTQRVMNCGDQVRKLLWSQRVVPNVAADEIRSASGCIEIARSNIDRATARAAGS